MTRRGTSGPTKAPGISRHARADAPRTKKPWIWLGLGVAVVVAVLLLAWRAGADRLKQINPAQAFDQYENGALILDVRSVAEWNAGHIPGSRVVPLDELEGRLGEVPRGQSIVVVCVSGVRSTRGGEILVAAGYRPVASLSGGLKAWDAAGYPLEQGTP